MIYSNLLSASFRIRPRSKAQNWASKLSLTYSTLRRKTRDSKLASFVYLRRLKVIKCVWSKYWLTWPRMLLNFHRGKKFASKLPTTTKIRSFMSMSSTKGKESDPMNSRRSSPSSAKLSVLKAWIKMDTAWAWTFVNKSYPVAKVILMFIQKAKIKDQHSYSQWKWNLSSIITMKTSYFLSIMKGQKPQFLL